MNVGSVPVIKGVWGYLFDDAGIYGLESKPGKHPRGPARRIPLLIRRLIADGGAGNTEHVPSEIAPLSRI